MLTVVSCLRACVRGLIFAAALPGPCPAQTVLPSPHTSAPASLPDPPGVQFVRMPDGSSIKRLPGDAGPIGAPTAQSARTAEAPALVGVKTRLNGNVLVMVAQEGPAATDSATPLRLTSRQVGASRVLELPGQPAWGAEPVAKPQALPRAVRIADLPTGASPPVFPEPNTLYRRPRE